MNLDGGQLITDLINPLSIGVVYTPVRDLSATFLDCCPVTVLEWSPRHDMLLPPVTKLESFISHRPHLSGYEQPLER